MLVTKLTRRRGRKYVPPGGDRFQPWNIESEIEVVLDPTDDLGLVKKRLNELLNLDLEEQKKECI